MASISEAVKPHVVMTPFPLQAHLISMLNLAKLLHFKGFHVTFVNTEFNHKRLLKSNGPNSLGGLPDFHFETIPDGLPPSDPDTTQDVISLWDSTIKNCLGPFRDLLARLNDSAADGLIPPVTCLVSDVIMTFSIKAARELGVPVALYCPIGASAFLGGAHSRDLIDKLIIAHKDGSYLANGYLDTKVDWIRGLKNIRLKDLTSTTDPNDFIINFSMDELERAKEGSAIIFNTFDDLEGDALNALSSMFPPIYTIGPIPLLLKQIPHDHLKSLGVNFWKEETECFQWLESKESRSVVYVNFGSSTIMSIEQLFEFAWGLANSKKSFLWIIRPDLVNGGSMILSTEFVNEIKERGLIASWCPQEKVLSHPSIGGFLTHCGWNSMTESISSGVPMICWPFGGDQQMSCRYACNEWGIGMEIDTDVRREAVEMLVNELMVGEKGSKMKQKMIEWNRIAMKDTRPGGSSYVNLEKVIKHVLLKQKD